MLEVVCCCARRRNSYGDRHGARRRDAWIDCDFERDSSFVG
jgi:hypothetical protein